jgi:hypothetical protein
MRNVDFKNPFASIRLLPIFILQLLRGDFCNTIERIEDQDRPTIEQATGTRPRGWLGPGLVETHKTIDILVEGRVQYCGTGTMTPNHRRRRSVDRGAPRSTQAFLV